jgi:hypothetical protein
MNLVTQAEFARQAGINKSNVTRAIQKGKLENFPGTKKIDMDAELTRAYLNNPSENRKLAVSISQGIIRRNGEGEPDKDLAKATTNALKAQEKKTIEEAELKRQQRIEKELKNAVRRSELVEMESVETMIMMFFDRWLNTNKRRFNAFFTELKRDILEGKRPDSEIKREYNNEFEEWAHDAKEETVKLLNEIEEQQAKG